MEKHTWRVVYYSSVALVNISLVTDCRDELAVRMNVRLRLCGT